VIPEARQQIDAIAGEIILMSLKWRKRETVVLIAAAAAMAAILWTAVEAETVERQPAEPPITAASTYFEGSTAASATVKGESPPKI
jgi:hypothetical protein